MKKFLIFICIIFIAILIFLNIYSIKKTKNIGGAVERYSTSGIFNEYKLYRLDTWEVEFSDGNMCIVNIKGLQKKSPHDLINYKMLLERNKKGLWKLKKIYKVP
ncbi:hypothetical protein [Haloimpatiens lingqiaonensis]|uniref:hypothetical protein n=1 Tax=Haloimpatiens lingqiaonensis TaxID=1380675 RepID=UPI0010FDE478|nr:hypothetical protein [Haloimpatiens lingqiaonensis]